MAEMSLREIREELGEWRASAKWAVAAFLVSLMLTFVLALVIPLLGGKGQPPSRRTVCIYNLGQIDGAKDQYALEYGGTADTLLTTSNIAIYIRDMSQLYCPLAEGTNRTLENSYALNCLTSPPTCRIHPERHTLSYVAAVPSTTTTNNSP